MEISCSFNNKLISNPFYDQNGEYFPYFTFKNFIKLCEQDRLDEFQFLKNAYDKLKKGFTSAYGSWHADDKPVEKSASPANVDAQPKDANPDAITEKNQGWWQKIKSWAAKMKDVVFAAAKMTGISAPLAMAIIFAGASGGMGAIPAGVILYFTRKVLLSPILAVAGKAYDTAVDVGRRLVRGPKVQTESVEIIKEWVFENNFKNYNLYKFIKNEGYISKSFSEWIANPNPELLNEGRVTDYLMSLLGRGAGHVAGFFTAAAKKVGKFLYNTISSTLQWVWKWKVPIGKFLFLMAIGMLVGGVVTKLTSPIVNDAVNSVKSALNMGAKVPPQEIAELEQLAKASAPADAPPQAPPSQDMPTDAFAAANQSDISGLSDAPLSTIVQSQVQAGNTAVQGFLSTIPKHFEIMQNKLVGLLKSLPKPQAAEITPEIPTDTSGATLPILTNLAVQNKDNLTSFGSKLWNSVVKARDIAHDLAIGIGEKSLPELKEKLSYLETLFKPLGERYIELQKQLNTLDGLAKSGDDAGWNQLYDSIVKQFGPQPEITLSKWDEVLGLGQNAMTKLDTTIAGIEKAMIAIK